MKSSQSENTKLVSADLNVIPFSCSLSSSLTSWYPLTPRPFLSPQPAKISKEIDLKNPNLDPILRNLFNCSSSSFLTSYCFQSTHLSPPPSTSWVNELRRNAMSLKLFSFLLSPLFLFTCYTYLLCRCLIKKIQVHSLALKHLVKPGANPLKVSFRIVILSRVWDPI